MTGILHQLDQQRLIGEAGGVVGALIFFYLSGTTDLADIYSDEALTEPLANPVGVAAGEILPTIYLDPAITYRRRVVYNDGTTSDLDPLPQDLTLAFLEAGNGSSYLGFTAEGAGSVARTVQSKLRDSVNVRDFGAVGDGVADDTAAFAAAFATHPVVYAPSGTYKISGTGFDMTSGQSLIGEGSYEVGTASAAEGTIFVPTASCTSVIRLLRGATSTIDSVVIYGVAFNGTNNDYAIYGDKVRQSVFENLRFNNFKKCNYLLEDSWLNRFINIKAFNFDVFLEGNSAFEDSTFFQVIARAYRTGSSGVIINSFGQTNAFIGCDFSELQFGVLVLLGSGACTLLFHSCYFEMDVQNTRGAITASAGSGTNVVIIAEGCRWFNKSGGALTTATAFEATGSGNVEIICNGGKFDVMNRIVNDATGSSLGCISGRGNIINGGTPTIYTNTRNQSKQLQFVSLANSYNLESIGALYTLTNSFGAGGTFALTFPDGTNGSLWEIYFTGNGAPVGLATYLYQPKGFFSNGLLTEVRDVDSNLSGSVSGNTVTWTAVAAADLQITVRKIA